MVKHLRLKRPLAVIGVGSSGVNSSTDRITEVAVLKYLSGDKPMSFMQRLNPGIPISSATAAIHGFTDPDVAKCRPFTDIARKLARILRGCDLAGFGIKKFDLPLLIAEFRRAEVSFPLVGCAVLGVFQVYHQLKPHDLQSAFASNVGGRFEGAHRARGDAQATALILDLALRRYSNMSKNVPELHRRLTDVDLGGWFRRDDGRIVFACGKHTGRALAEVAQKTPG